MSKYRTIINMSPSFIKVMPFKCTGVNLLKLESYTNSFTNVHEGLVCIFRAENTNTGPVRVKLSELTNELKLLDVDGNDIPAGFIKANMYLQASYDGTNLVLHNDNSNIELEAGANIIIDKKPDGTVVISAVNTNTWRPITDSLTTEDSNTSTSAKVAKLLNDKISAITTIVNDNKILQDNIADTVIEILTEIDNLKLIDNDLTNNIAEVDGKVDTNIREITSIKSELANKANSNHEHGTVTNLIDGFMSKADKAKLDGIATGANNYVHPNDASTRHVTDAEKNKWNGKADGSHEHEVATTLIDGFMSKGDKIKLDGIATGANNYVHPNDASTRHVTDAEKNKWNGKAESNHGHSTATSSADGFMSKADKTKLDGIATGANNYVHPGSGTNPHGTTKSDLGLSNVNNWGASSDIAANSTSQYATTNMVAKVRSEKANTNHTHSYMSDGGSYGTIKLSNWIRTTGNTGWYSETYGGGWYMTDSTWIRSYNNKPIHVAGNDITCTNNIVAYYSDERLKKNFKEINNALNMIMSINPYYYEQNEFAKELGYNEEGKIQIGFKAQEIEKILPQIIQEAPVNHRNDLSDDIRSKIGETPIKTIDYAKITPLLWKAIQEQQKQIEKLENLLILKGVI